MCALGAATWATAACGGAPDPSPGTAPPRLPRANVLLVTIDTLRVDHVGAYGNASGLTPTIDRLAAEGLRIDTVYSHVPAHPAVAHRDHDRRLSARERCPRQRLVPLRRQAPDAGRAR